MTTKIDDILSAFFAELQQTSGRYAVFIKQAEEAGQPQLAKTFRSILASEAARAKLYRVGITAHAEEKPDYFVCPHCGLVFVGQAPEKCPVDETLGAQFEQIS